MKAKGSITIMLCLTLTIMTALVAAGFRSVQNASARAVAAGGADAALYSLFGEYDRDLLEHYELFFLDGAYGGNRMKLGKITDRITYGMEKVLETDLMKTSVKQCGLTAYCLATDSGGESFKRQAAAWTRDSLGSQAVSRILKQAKGDSETVRILEEKGEKLREREDLEEYDRMLEEYQEAETGETERAEDETMPIPGDENPIEILRKVKKMGVLGMVVPDSGDISEKQAEVSEFLSCRSLNQGLGNSRGRPEDAGVSETLLYQEYVLKKMGNYSEPCREGDLSYQLEYILAGQDSDQENLRKVVQRLLLIREAANYAAIYTDPVKRGQAATLGLTLASAAGIPAGQQLAETLVILCWAYGESLLDVRDLLAGGRVPLVKSQGQWKLSLNNLPHILELLREEGGTGTEGMEYQGYLRVLLYLSLEKEDTEVYRCMDMVENVMRKTEGKGGFRLDQCLESAEAELTLIGPRGQEWSLIRSYGYDMKGE